MSYVTREERVSQFNAAAQGLTHVEGGDFKPQLTCFTEEVIEFYEAISNYQDSPTEENRKNLCKEWADVQVTLSNLAWYFNIPGELAFSRVHENNMTKLKDGKIVRRADGKILKPEGYVPANMEGL